MAQNDTISSRKAAAREIKEISPFPVFDPTEFTKIGNRNIEIATRAARAYFNGATKLNREAISFFSARVKTDMETARSFMASKTSEQAFHAQAQFVESAIRDYADEASRVMHLTADMARETLTPVEERTEEVLHSIDERAKKPKAAE